METTWKRPRTNAPPCQRVIHCRQSRAPRLTVRGDLILPSPDRQSLITNAGNLSYVISVQAPNDEPCDSRWAMTNKGDETHHFPQSVGKVKDQRLTNSTRSSRRRRSRTLSNVRNFLSFSLFMPIERRGSSLTLSCNVLPLSSYKAHCEVRPKCDLPC